MTRNHLVTMTRMLSYSARTASLLPLLIHEAATRGNYGPLAAQAMMAGEDLERMIAMGMHNSVVCSEDAPLFEGAVDRAALEKTYIGPLMLDGMKAICEVWPRGAVDADFHEPLRLEGSGAAAVRRVRPGHAAGLRRGGGGRLRPSTCTS